MWGFIALISRKHTHNPNINLLVECTHLCSPDWPLLVGLGLEVAKKKKENELKSYF